MATLLYMILIMILVKSNINKLFIAITIIIIINVQNYQEMSWTGSNFPITSCKRINLRVIFHFLSLHLSPASPSCGPLTRYFSRYPLCISQIQCMHFFPQEPLPSNAQKMLMPEDWPGGLGAVGFD